MAWRVLFGVPYPISIDKASFDASISALQISNSVGSLILLESHDIHTQRPILMLGVARLECNSKRVSELMTSAMERNHPIWKMLFP